MHQAPDLLATQVYKPPFNYMFMHRPCLIKKAPDWVPFIFGLWVDLRVVEDRGVFGVELHLNLPKIALQTAKIIKD